MFKENQIIELLEEINKKMNTIVILLKTKKISKKGEE